MENTIRKRFSASFKFIFIAMLLICHVQTCFCQLLTNDNITLTITSGTQLTIQGDVQNQNGATIANAGTIDLSGNWIHNAANNCFGTSIGTVILNGANQTIGGTSSTTFNNLTLLGTGSKSLLINATVGGSFNTGILNIGARNLILNSKSLSILNPNSTAISFTTGFITSEQTNNSSKIIWSINAVTGLHTIPFGNAAGVQIPFSYNLTSGNAGNVTVSTYATTPNNLPLPFTPDSVKHIRNNLGLDNSANTVDRFWEIDNTGTPTATFTFTWATTENAANGNVSPRAQRWIAAPKAWQTALSGQSNPTTQSVVIPGVTYTGFGPWAVALASSPLPISLISFEAEAKNSKTVLCNWATASETNNDYFTVERSKNGIDFEEAGQVKAAGNSTKVLNYSFNDLYPYSGVSYYRLKQTDVNGAFTCSQTEKVLFNNSKVNVNVYPNPAHGHFTVSIPDMEQYKMMLIDASGRLIIDLSQNVNPNSNMLEVNTTTMKPGIYYLQLTSASNTQTAKVVVE